jgi:hypothetical protein
VIAGFSIPPGDGFIVHIKAQEDGHPAIVRPAVGRQVPAGPDLIDRFVEALFGPGPFLFDGFFLVVVVMVFLIIAGGEEEGEEE